MLLEKNQIKYPNYKPKFISVVLLESTDMKITVSNSYTFSKRLLSISLFTQLQTSNNVSARVGPQTTCWVELMDTIFAKHHPVSELLP